MENTKTPESEREGNTSIQPDSVKKLENLFEKVKLEQLFFFLFFLVDLIFLSRFVVRSPLLKKNVVCKDS